MKKYKILYRVFAVAAILLSDAMCACVAYSYADMVWGIKYLAYSAPAQTAFLVAVPFAAGIIACAILSFVFYKKASA